MSGLPGFVQDAWGETARQVERFAGAITTKPLPSGVRTDVARIVIGSLAGTLTSENAPLPEQDLQTGAGTLSPTCTASGLVDTSQQSVDWSGGMVDLAIARDLAAAIGTVTEQQVINGTGSNGQTLGLMAWSGTNSYAAGTVSVDSNWSRYVNARAGHETTYGTPADFVLLHPRRLAYLEQGGGTRSALPWRADVLTSGQMPTNYGAGGTQDPIVLANRDQLVLYSSPTTVRAIVDWSGPSGLTVRYAAHRFFSFEVLQPKGVSCLSGIGLGTPSFV